MIRNATPGRRVQVWYRNKSMLLQAKFGVIRYAGKGPGPRNVAVKVGSVTYVIPKGNLRPC